MKIKETIAYGVSNGEYVLCKSGDKWSGVENLAKIGFQDIALYSLSDAEEEAQKRNAEVVRFSIVTEDVDQKGPQAVYVTVQDWINNNRGTSAARGLARLVVGLYNYDLDKTPLRQCLSPLDNVRHSWAEDLVKDFFARDESDELKDLARRILDNNILEA